MRARSRRPYPCRMTSVSPDATEAVAQLAGRARVAARELALMSRAAKDATLHALADALDAATDRIVAANAVDLERGRNGGMPASLQDRLVLTPERVTAIADALRDIAALPDPVGEIVRGSTLANGLQIRQLRVPMGVVGMIYEARPNVTVDAAGLGLKSGNAVILRGGSAAADSNRVLVDVMRESLAAHGVNPDAIGLLEGGHDAVRALMTARGLVDLLIPRGGADLINSVVLNSTVPVIETGIGNCHVYVDRAADLDKALAITMNSKTHRPSVCNAAESLLVHESVAPDFLPKALTELAGAGVVLHTDERASAIATEAGVPFAVATDDDFATEFHALEMSVGVVSSLDDALEHVRTYGSGHTEAIVTEDRSAARRWSAEVDAAAVMVNASTRFTDGGEFGFGAEIGISTQKLHARGPMALPELTTTKWIVEGDGHVRV
jgi:glutamate-5-semialdehyde dehydrogenase